MNPGITVSMPRRRRRSSGIPKAAPPDLGTPETAARLRPPPWHNWPSELQAAAIQIDHAVRLIAGNLLVQAQNTAAAAHYHPVDWDEDSPQAHQIARYRRWVHAMARHGIPLQATLDVIVWGKFPSNRRNCDVRTALELWR